MCTDVEITTDLELVCVILIKDLPNSPQYKNANIANFVLARLLERNWTNEVCNLEM